MVLADFIRSRGTYQPASLYRDPTLAPPSAPPKILCCCVAASFSNSATNTQNREHQSSTPASARPSQKFSTIQNATSCIGIMSGVGLEVLLEGLIPEIAYSGEKGEFGSRALSVYTAVHCVSLH